MVAPPQWNFGGSAGAGLNLKSSAALAAKGAGRHCVPFKKKPAEAGQGAAGERAPAEGDQKPIFISQKNSEGLADTTITVAALDWVNVGGALARLG
jgi:hypothetical protein